MEEAVIRGGDWQTFRPAVLVIEAVLAYPGVFRSPAETSSVYSDEAAVVRSSLEHILSNEGYDLCYFDGLNEFFIAREAQHLRDLITVPPNVFDRFVPSRQIETERRLKQALEDLDELKRQLEKCQRELSQGS